MRLAYLLALVVCAAQSAEISSTRTTSYDWACQDAAGATLSSHTREGTAITACANRALADGKVYFVQGGRYRITTTVVPVTPPVTPPVVPPVVPPVTPPTPTPPTPPVVTPSPSNPAPVELNWTAPAINTDGSDIKLPLCYVVEYGLGRAFDKTHQTCAQTATIVGLGIGTHFFRVVTIDGNGTRSGPSAEVGKFFQ